MAFMAARLPEIVDERDVYAAFAHFYVARFLGKDFTVDRINPATRIDREKFGIETKFGNQRFQMEMRIADELGNLIIFQPGRTTDIRGGMGYLKPFDVHGMKLQLTYRIESERYKITVHSPDPDAHDKYKPVLPVLKGNHFMLTELLGFTRELNEEGETSSRDSIARYVKDL